MNKKLKILVIGTLLLSSTLGLASVKVEAQENVYEVKTQQVSIEGQKYDLYKEFVNQEASLADIKNKYHKEISFIQKENDLEDLTENYYIEYQNAFKEIALDGDYNNKELHKISNDILVFFDIFENKNQNNEIKKMPKSNLTEEDKTNLYLALPYSSTEHIQRKNLLQDARLNTSAAITYAKKHATNRNLSQYAGLSADCTNFVSQILHAGGVSQVGGSNEYSGWWHRKLVTPMYDRHTHSVSWIQANTFAKYMGYGKTTTNHATFASNVRKGDFIAIDFGNDGSFDHMGYVTNKSGSDYEVAQHTSDYLAWVSSSKNGWETYSGKGKYAIVR